MAISIERRRTGESWTVLAVVGHVDTTAAVELEQACRTELCPGLRLALDLSGVSYLCSAGLRAILGVTTEVGPLGAQLVLVNPQPGVRETLSISGFARFLPVVDSLQSLL